MQSTRPPNPVKEQPRIRAVVELIDDQLKIFPVCDTEDDEQAIMEALRFVREIKNEKARDRNRRLFQI